MHVKFEVHSFNRFKLVWLTGTLRTDTHSHTSNKNTISAIHSVHLAEIHNNVGIKDTIRKHYTGDTSGSGGKAVVVLVVIVVAEVAATNRSFSLTGRTST